MYKAEEMEEHVPAKTQGLKKHFREFFTRTDPESGLSHLVIDVAPVTKHEIYLAIEERRSSSSSGGGGSAAEGEPGWREQQQRRVFARLCLPLLRGDNDGAAAEYRVEDEGDPPSLNGCPLRILYLLTPTEQVSALEWRLRCYERQVEEARRALAETEARYAATHFDSFRDYVRKSAQMMVERRFLILHQAMSAAQTTRALLETAAGDRPALGSAGRESNLG